MKEGWSECVEKYYLEGVVHSKEHSPLELIKE